MLSESGLKSISLLRKGKVVLEKATPDFYFIYVDGETVTYNRLKDIWVCSCIHESWRGAIPKKNDICYHIKSAKIYVDYLKRKGDNNDMPSL